MSKKILSVMLALVMVLSVFSVCAFAAVNVRYETYNEDEGETEVAYTQYWSLETDNVPNDAGEYTVNVSLQANYAVGVMSFVLATEGATITKAVAGEAVTTTTDADGNPVETDFNADVKISDDKTTVYIIPDPVDDGSDGLDLTNGGVVATLTFKLNDGVSAGTVALVNDAKTIDNDGKLIAIRLGNGKLAAETMYYGQRIIDVDGNDLELDAEIASVTLGEEKAAEADLALTEAGATAGVIIDTAKTFGGAYAGVVYGFPGIAATAIAASYYDTYVTATNGGTITVVKTPYVTKPARYGTGATIQVYNSDGTLSKTYVVVIFGDVDGTGNITALDASKVTAEIASASFTDVQRMAANVVKLAKGTAANKAAYLYNIAAIDSSTITSDVAVPGSAILVSTIATEHNTYNTYYQ